MRDVLLASCAIGVEFHAPGYAKGLLSPDQWDFNVFVPFTDAQMATGTQLLQDILERHTIDIRNIVAHSDIQTGKTDPGPLFPWHTLAEDGVGTFPASQETTVLATDHEYVMASLRKIGYRFDDSELDVYVNKFRMRFMTDTEWKGTNEAMDAPFLARLAGVVAAYV